LPTAGNETTNDSQLPEVQTARQAKLIDFAEDD
jgi:hypothetical protein